MHVLIDRTHMTGSKSIYARSVMSIFKDDNPVLIYGLMTCVDEGIIAKYIQDETGIGTDYYLAALPASSPNKASFDWGLNRLNVGTYKWDSYNTHPVVKDAVAASRSSIATLKKMDAIRKSYPCVWLPVNYTTPSSNKFHKHLLTTIDD